MRRSPPTCTPLRAPSWFHCDYSYRLDVADQLPLRPIVSATTHAFGRRRRRAFHVDGDHLSAGSGAAFRQQPPPGEEDDEEDEEGRGTGASMLMMLGGTREEEELGFGHIRRTHTQQGDDDHFGKLSHGTQLSLAAHDGGSDAQEQDGGGIRAVDGARLAFRPHKSLNKSLGRHAACSECVAVLAAPWLRAWPPQQLVRPHRKRPGGALPPHL